MICLPTFVELLFSLRLTFGVATIRFRSRKGMNKWLPSRSEKYYMNGSWCLSASLRLWVFLCYLWTKHFVPLLVRVLLFTLTISWYIAEVSLVMWNISGVFLPNWGRRNCLRIPPTPLYPKSLRTLVINDVHNDGHFGIDKVVASVHAQFYWPSIDCAIATFVKRCPIC